MNCLKKFRSTLSAGLLGLCVFTGGALALDDNGNTSANMQTTGSKLALREVTFKIHKTGKELRGLESAPILLLQKWRGVRYVGVNYKTLEMVVRYQPSHIDLKQIVSALEELGNFNISIMDGPKNMDSTEPMKSFRPGVEFSIPEFSHLRLKCLTSDEARLLCDQHREELPQELDLDQCHVIQVAFSSDVYDNGEYDWLSQVCLVDSEGRFVKPANWLKLGSVKESPIKGSVSGLLIFPRVPLLQLGLALRFLRANGEGYDSFSVSVPDF
ncbi:heavy-metal-associated domain-containing protein [candidate division KSB1 bacterium]|nr:heavy-metal-associated domain-containing protein [candidate division KSB1 bacterium]NIR69037.1 heavy-metal-associated domain-containing protein [candidate division KSB1 bacterium]NIS25605.1 heavy-metal-associated domain-containing protein [candidate division KSB1 bacterium]NIT73955.1 heavy-metal-associated domain-containing protein [candidate division KSB1 bacterium]NIU26282.1 heavy-metal-associated domain-containing protein [candidate division KSB1 bacterium]